jgi:hypothetical protein
MGFDEPVCAYVKLTVPPGTAAPEFVGVTVAVNVIDWFTAADGGDGGILVAVGSPVTCCVTIFDEEGLKAVFGVGVNLAWIECTLLVVVAVVKVYAQLGITPLTTGPPLQVAGVPGLGIGVEPS